MQVADLEQRLGALALVLSDADEDARRERHGEAPRVLDRPQAHGRDLVGRACVRAAVPAVSRSLAVSSMMPIEALTCFRRASSS